MDWLALLFKHFNMRGTYQLCSVFEEGVLAHQSIRGYDVRNWTGKNVLQRRNQLRKIIRPDTSVQEQFRLPGDQSPHGCPLKLTCLVRLACRPPNSWWGFCMRAFTALG